VSTRLQYLTIAGGPHRPWWLPADGERAPRADYSSTKVGTRHGQWVGYVVTATVTATIRR
jgi:hypothetical protein